MTALDLLLAVALLKCGMGDTQMTWRQLASLPLADAKMIAGYDSTTNRLVVAGGGDDGTRRYSIKFIENAQGEEEKVDWENNVEKELEISLRANGQSMTSIGNKAYFIGSDDLRLHYFIPYSNKSIHIQSMDIEFEGYVNLYYVLHAFCILN